MSHQCYTWHSDCFFFSNRADYTCQERSGRRPSSVRKDCKVLAPKVMELLQKGAEQEEGLEQEDDRPRNPTPSTGRGHMSQRTTRTYRPNTVRASTIKVKKLLELQKCNLGLQSDMDDPRKDGPGSKHPCGNDNRKGSTYRQDYKMTCRTKVGHHRLKPEMNHIESYR